jgi:hypothetical protein
MIELFAQWAPDDSVTGVTEEKKFGNTENINDINHVTGVTDVTGKKQQPEKKLPNRSLAEIFTDCTKNAVTPVTTVTPSKSLDKSCYRSLNPCGNSGNNSTPTMTAEMVVEGMKWPPETQRLWGVVREWFEARGYQFHESGALASLVVKQLIKRHGGSMVLIDELPVEVRQATDLVQDTFGSAEIEWTPKKKTVH